MRAIPRLPTLLGAAAVTLACGSAPLATTPPSSELELVVSLNPDASGGIRPSTTVIALLFAEDAVVGGTLQSAEFTVFDAQGGVLARESVAGPLTIGPDGSLTVRKTLDWMPADVLGRTLRVRFVMSSSVIERTVTF